MKAVGDHPCASSGVRSDGRLQADLEMPVPGAVLGEGLDLLDERRHQVERDPNARGNSSSIATMPQ